jgi:hypothetical protein
MTRAGLLMREICECLNVDVQPCDLGVVLIERDEQKWSIAASTIDQRLIICSELTRFDLRGSTSDYYLRMNADLKMMRGGLGWGWFG